MGGEDAISGVTWAAGFEVKQVQMRRGEAGEGHGSSLLLSSLLLREKLRFPILDADYYCCCYYENC